VKPWWRRFLCRIGWHDHELVTPVSSEELGKQMIDSRDGVSLLTLLVSSIMACTWRCKHCDHELHT
jgi:hypothetical protein